MEKNKYFIGVDLGTSSVKTVLIDINGKVIKVASQEYPLIIEKNLYVEQDATQWWAKTIATIKEVLKDFNEKIEAISFSGQMHGMVLLDKNNELIHNAILWNDQRTYEEVSLIKKAMGIEQVLRETANMPIEGFTFPKLLWIKKHKQDIYKKIHKLILPKDYLVYRLTGVYATDHTDASGTGMYSVQEGKWSREILDVFKIDKNILPKIYYSTEIIKNINSQVAKEIGINEDCKIIIGAGDQAANAIGLGVTSEDKIALSLGTSACVFVGSEKFKYNKHLHSFAHSNGKYHLLGVSQSGGGSVKWFFEEVLKIKDYSIINNFNLDDDSNVFFLPYLTGERHPIHDPLAKALFVGMDRGTTQDDMFKAVLEGVSFSIKQIIKVFNELKIFSQEMVVAGGGGNNEYWMQILSTIIKLPVSIIENNLGGALGAAIIAMVGTKSYLSIEEACKTIVQVAKTYKPNENLASKIDQKFAVWKQIYPLVKSIYKPINELSKKKD